MAQVAYVDITSERAVAPVARPTPPVLRDAGRKARLSGVTSGDPMAELMAALPKALGRRLRFHEPSASEPSFDELWLANVFDAVRQGDATRYRFAMLSRMSKERASSLHFLMCRAVYSLDIT